VYGAAVVLHRPGRTHDDRWKMKTATERATHRTEPDRVTSTKPKYPALPKYRYGTSWSNEVHAYTREEWGLGGHNPSESSNMANSFIGQSIVAILMTIPAALAPFGIIFGILALIMSFPDLGEMGMGLVVTLVAAICTVLFTGGWLLSVRAIRDELRARKLRKPKGMPKPLYEVPDDQARRWFEEHPGTIEITRENFPFSTLPFPGEPDHLPSQEKRA
jgi:cation transport ATPase